MTSGGNGKPFFVGMPGQSRLGSLLRVSQPVTLGLLGVGGASIDFQPIISWRKIMTP
jgi:hypothetical protein